MNFFVHFSVSCNTLLKNKQNKQNPKNTCNKEVDFFEFEMNWTKLLLFLLY